MSLKTTIISSFAKFMLGSDTFERLKGVILRQESKEISGEEKRQAAFEEIKLIGLGIATWLINLSIELCVSYFRSLETKYDKK